MSVSIDHGSIVLDNDAPFVFIGGPCVIENESHALSCAEQIKKITDEVGIGFIYKSSFDKANRSSIGSFRGVGIDEGLKILQRVRESVGVPIVSDVHTPEEATMAGKVLDILQIPAFLCRQTDLLLAAGATGKVINVKKGQFMAPWDMKNVIEKVKSSGNERVMVTERGVSFGYNTLVADMTSIYELARLGSPVIFDAGHSVQRPGGLGSASGGNRDLIPTLARAAVASKVAGIFLEVHPDPDNAPCDGPNTWPVDKLRPLLMTLQEIDKIVKSQ